MTAPTYDLVIAGAGVAGCMAAIEIVSQRSHWKIAIVDKEAPMGGRIASMDTDKGFWGYGLNRISEKLFKHLDELLRRDPEADDLTAYARGQDESLGVLAAGKLTEHSFAHAFSAQGARAIAGVAAVRDWKLIDSLAEQISDGKKIETVLSQAYKGTRKSPSAIVLEHVARLHGIADPWSVAAGDLWERLATAKNEHWRGSWESALSSLAARGRSLADNGGGSYEHMNECRMTDAQFADELWQIKTTKGVLKSKKLLVAQSPWDAAFWLPRTMWPQKLLTMSSKTKPTSAVVLADRHSGAEALQIDRILIPAENTQVVVDQSAIYFQATLEYELTLRAPDVVKAVKRLRRSRKKLSSLFPDLKLEGDHIALLPVAWAPPLALADRRVIKRLSFEKLMEKHLAFCGESYGSSVCGDQNLLESLESATKALLSGD